MRRIYALLLICICLPSWADSTPLTYDRIHLNSSASADVDNDLLVAVLFTQSEGSAAEPLAREVNRVINKALKRLEQAPEIRVQTQSYRTHAVYRKSEISGWRVYQSLRLESQNAQLLSSWIGKLQNELKVQSIGFQVADDTRRAAQNNLTDQALSRFRQRAQAISEQLGRSGYRIVRINIGNGRAAPMMMRNDLRMAEASSAPAPRIEAGQQRIEVNVSGEIELLAD